MTEYLPLATLLRLLAVLVLVWSPHVVRLPVWESVFILGLIGWRGLAAYKQWRMPPTWIKLLITLLAAGGVMASYGRVSGQHAGTALLCIMGALKLLEFKGRRDVMVMLFLMYFMQITHFLFSQEIWTIAYLLVCVVATTTLLVECQHRGALPLRVSLRSGGAMVLQALPLMLLLFVLFPRLPGPLWGLPADAGATARTGLSDRMAPGDIASLIESEEVAFRVEFFGAVPPQTARYWRGPVFDHFDGRTWEEGFPQLRTQAPPAVQPLDGPIRYALTLEPHRSRWLLALDMPAPTALPRDAFLGREAQLLTAKPVNERRRYELTSYLDYRLGARLTERERARYLRLPRDSNPRTQALAAQWRTRGADDAAVVRTALQMFRDEPFVYTLRPPTLGANGVDQFLFETRRGFCEHYSSAFTVLMRAAGIPARVVTGYQGGQPNGIGDYYVVRQSDAHAWSEVWLEERGWVRIDPTAAVAPSRIEQSIAAAIPAAEGLPGYLSARTQLRFYLEARWDWLNAQWNGLVLAYGPELQREFLGRFGLADLRSMILALTFGGTALLALMGLFTLRRFLPAHSEDAPLRHWRRMTRRLARAGFPQRPDEGPLDYAARVAAVRPEWAGRLQAVARAYVGSRYLENAPVDELARAVRRFRTT